MMSEEHDSTSEEYWDLYVRRYYDEDGEIEGLGY